MKRLPCLAVLLVVGFAPSLGCQRDDPTNRTVAAEAALPRQTAPVVDPEIARWDEEVRGHPDSAEAHANRAKAWHARSRFDLAMPDYDAAIRLDPTNSRWFDSRGFAHHMNNRQEEKALADYDEAIRLKSDNANALNNRAYLRATTLVDSFRDGRAAVEDAVKACELTHWKNSGYLDTLAVAYAEVGDFDQAIHWQQKALEDPRFEQSSGPQARRQLELFRRKMPYRE